MFDKDKVNESARHSAIQFNDRNDRSSTFLAHFDGFNKGVRYVIGNFRYAVTTSNSEHEFKCAGLFMDIESAKFVYGRMCDEAFAKASANMDDKANALVDCIAENDGFTFQSVDPTNGKWYNVDLEEIHSEED